MSGMIIPQKKIHPAQIMTVSERNQGSERGLKVVYVDDDISDQELFAEAITHIDTNVDLVLLNGCIDLVDFLEKHPPIDLIFLDINLPIIDGKVCLRTLKEHPVYKSIPIVIITGSNSERDIDDVHRLGAHYHMIKPIAHLNLVASLKIIFSINWKEKQPVPVRDKFIINLAFLD